jgi:hypothetical protein
MLETGGEEYQLGRLVACGVGAVTEEHLALDESPRAALDERADGLNRTRVG